MKFQEKYENFLVTNGLIEPNAIKHYGVKGMKWGVRKSVYKSLTRDQRKALRGAAETSRVASDQRRSIAKRSAKLNKKLVKYNKRGNALAAQDIKRALKDLASKNKSLDAQEKLSVDNIKSSLKLKNFDTKNAARTSQQREILWSLLTAPAFSESRKSSDIDATVKRYAQEGRYDKNGMLKPVKSKKK